MNEDGKQFFLFVSWAAAILMVITMFCCCVFHRCPQTTACANPQCCKPVVAEKPQ